MRLIRIRPPRIRYTIGRLMAVVLVAGLGSWVIFFAGPRIQNHRIAVQQALANLKQATLVREVAEYALKEYNEGIYLQDKATYEGMIALARSDRNRQAEQIARQRADFYLEQARTQLEVLEKYTRPKQIKSLQADIDKARADEQARIAAYRRELAMGWWNLLGF